MSGAIRWLRISTATAPIWGAQLVLAVLYLASYLNARQAQRSMEEATC